MSASRAPWSTAPFEPRAWQRAAYDAIKAGLARDSRVVVQAVMGSGKSVLIAELVRMSALAGTRIVVSTPTIPLVDQLSETIESWAGIEVGRWYTHSHTTGQVTVTCNPSVPEIPDVGSYQLWIADEVHRTESARMHAAAAAIQPRWAIGLSATPYRSDESERLQLWDRVVYEYTPGQAIRDGVLVPYRIETLDHTAPDLDEGTRRLIRQHAEGPGVVSAASVRDAEHYAEYLTRYGVPARAIHSRMPRRERAEVISWLRGALDEDGHPREVRALVHVLMLVEGVDIPWLRWLAIRRPRQRVGAIQEIGRVLRTAPNKSEAILLDPLDTMGGLTLHYDAALGWEAEVPEEVREIQRLAEEQEISERDAAGQALRRREPIVVRPIQRYLRACYLALVDTGRVEPPKSITSTSWRSRRPSQSQLRHLGRMVWAARLTGELRPACELLSNGGHYADGLTRGAVSDLLSILHSAADWRGRGGRERETGEPWWPASVEVPPMPPILEILRG